MIPDGDPSKHEELTVFNIRFVGEQDGPAERDLKSHLTTSLGSEPAVHRGYLARVHYENATAWDVALCLAASNPDERSMNERIGRLFAGIFRPDMHLDVLFLSANQEADLANV